jgi:hypothetical protein
MPALHTHENGVTVLLPYAMPVSLDGAGEPCSQGRYCIAYARDGWFLLDTERDVILGWFASEDAAVEARWRALDGVQA